MIRLLLRMTAVAALVVAGCARQGRPGGGPVDKTAPRVIDHRPGADATGIALDRPIAIEFSEGMDRGRTEEAVFLAPHTDVDMTWSGPRLGIEARGGLSAGRTYVVTVGTDARDLRGNRLEPSFSFAFATGEHLDAGTLEGRIVDAAHAPAGGAFVWAYDLERFDGRTAVAPPAYVTQSGADGRYRFERLAGGTYRVIAFRDGNRNQRPDGAEPVSLPAADAAVAAEGVVPAGDQFLSVAEAAVQVARASAIDRTHVALVFDRPVEAARLTVEIPDLRVQSLYGAAGDPLRVMAATEVQEPGRSYRPRVYLDGEPLVGPEEPVRGSARADARPPAVAATAPAGAIVSAERLVVAFDECMDTSTAPAATDWDLADSTAPPRGTWHWEDPTHLAYILDEPLAAGECRMAVRLTRVRDAAGLGPEDSVATFTFERLPAADVCAVSGTVRWSREGPVRVVLTAPGGAVVETVADADREFRLEGLAPGRYTLFAYVDRDGDGRPDGGTLDPYAPAEPYALYGEVRLERGQRARADLPAPGSAP